MNIGHRSIKTIDYKILLTNARSLSPKIESLHLYFEEHKIDVALITESWLKDGQTLDRDVIDLEHGTDLKIIYRNRPKKSVGSRVVGGGVSIVYSKSRCNLRERRIVGNKFELVVAVGRVGKLTRGAAFFCLYMEPKMKVAEVRQVNDIIADQILQLKANGDPLIFVGGDLNKKCIGDSFSNFDDFSRANWEPTRGNACLDVLYSNTDLSSRNWPPLQTSAGVESDHCCVIYSGREDVARNFTWVKKTARKFSYRAARRFGSEMANTDWDALIPPDVPLDPDEILAKLQGHMLEAVDRLFPMKTTRCRTNEAPWITHAIRRIAKQKRRVYRRERKSRLWQTLQDRVTQMTYASKEEFVNAASTGGTSTRRYYDAVKRLGTKTPPAQWSLTDLFPDLDPSAAAEETAAFFTRITDQYTPLQPSRSAPPMRRPITEDEVEKKLRDAKKPNSAVRGDIPPKLMAEHFRTLVVPITRLFNAVFRTSKWPTSWKEETTVVIPKTPNPGSLAECRNISCTAFLSKVLEAVLLEDLRAEIAPDPAQYGGIKQCSGDHMLIDLFEMTHSALDSGDPTAVLGIDFEKAFNRLDHGECLLQLRALGASTASLALVRSFLTNRRMMVKLPDGSLSDPRPLKGGSPQGSILGCFLYCVATQQLGPTLLDDAPGLLDRTGTPPPEGPRDVLPGDHSVDGPEEVGMNVMAWAADDVPQHPDSDDSFVTALESSVGRDPDLSVGDDPGCRPETIKYVDDTTLVERIHSGAGVRHITGLNPTETQHPAGIELLMDKLIERAGEIGMVVNCKKTQLVCISPDNGYTTTACLQAGGEQITSGREMKLLGFMLSADGGMQPQIDMLKRKFRAKFWSLIHLRRAGIQGQKLFRIYAAMVRPVLETNCVVYHSMINRGQALDLERMQKSVARLCFGFHISYDQARTDHGFETLEERRSKAARRFTAKALSNPRFGPKWFKRRPEVETDIRNRRPFVEKKARTQRYYNSPLLHMQRLANDLSTGK